MISWSYTFLDKSKPSVRSYLRFSDPETQKEEEDFKESLTRTSSSGIHT